MNIHWPKTKENNFKPWYLILYHLPWGLMALLGSFLIGMSMCFGTFSLSNGIASFKHSFNGPKF